MQPTQQGAMMRPPDPALQSLILAALVRSGCWLSTSVGARLELELCHLPADAAQARGLSGDGRHQGEGGGSPCVG
jgi:hypothetical protein